MHFILVSITPQLTEDAADIGNNCTYYFASLFYVNAIIIILLVGFKKKTLKNIKYAGEIQAQRLFIAE